MGLPQIFGSIAGGAASALVGWGLNKISKPKTPSAPPMPAFDMPKYEPPTFTFDFPKYEPPPPPPPPPPAPPRDEALPPPKIPDAPTPAPAAPIDQSITNASIVARKKASEDAMPVSDSDIILTKTRDRKKKVAEGGIRRTRLG